MNVGVVRHHAGKSVARQAWADKGRPCKRLLLSPVRKQRGSRQCPSKENDFGTPSVIGLTQVAKERVAGHAGNVGSLVVLVPIGREELAFELRAVPAPTKAQQTAESAPAESYDQNHGSRAR